MFSPLLIVIPIFALILSGCRKTSVMGPAASGEINRFVVTSRSLPCCLKPWPMRLGRSSTNRIYRDIRFRMRARIHRYTVGTRQICRLLVGEFQIKQLSASYANAAFIWVSLLILSAIVHATLIFSPPTQSMRGFQYKRIRCKAKGILS